MFIVCIIFRYLPNPPAYNTPYVVQPVPDSAIPAGVGLVPSTTTNPIQPPSQDHTEGIPEPALYQPVAAGTTVGKTFDEEEIPIARPADTENAKAPEPNPIMFRGVRTPVHCHCPN